MIFFIRLLPVILLISFPVFAKEAVSMVFITGVVSIPTCTINGNKYGGLSQTVDMGRYKIGSVIAGNAKAIDVPLIIDCSGSTGSTGLKGISMSVSTLGPYGAVGPSQPGAIKTTLNGVSIVLRWKKDNTLVGLFSGAQKQFPNDGNNIYDASIKSKLSSMPGFSHLNIEEGGFVSGLNVKLRYY